MYVFGQTQSHVLQATQINFAIHLNTPITDLKIYDIKWMEKIHKNISPIYFLHAIQCIYMQLYNMQYILFFFIKIHVVMFYKRIT